MSFLEELQRKKRKLKTTETLVKTHSGDVFLEKRSEGGEISCEKVASHSGYVVDLKPDLQVGAVLPGLFMGSQDVTQEESILKKYNITHILSVGVRVFEQPGISYMFIEALDLPEFDMLPVFTQSNNLIDFVRKSGDSIFVHCNAGVSRSAAIVIAYLMGHEKLTYQEACDLLQKVRPCIRPNQGFVNQLKLLEKEWFSI